MRGWEVGSSRRAPPPPPHPSNKGCREITWVLAVQVLTMVCHENSNIWWIALGYSIPFDVSSSSLTRGYPSVTGFYMQMCRSLTLCWQRSALRLRPELTARMKTTYFVVAEGLLSCAFTHASSWENPRFWQFFRLCMCATLKYLDH